MTAREKKLALGVLGAVVTFGAYKLVMTSILEPRWALVAEHDRQLERRARLEERLLGQVAIERQWEAQVSRTLAASDQRDAAVSAFRAAIVRLLKEHALPENDVQSREPIQAAGSKNYRKGFWELPLAVGTEGTIDQLSSFLHELYELPFHVTVTRLTVNPKDGEAAVLSAAADANGSKVRRNDRAQRGDGPGNPRLRISLELATLVLPRVDGVRHLVYSPDQPPKPIQRKRFDDSSHYRTIAANNVFAVWQPPPPPEPPPRVEPEKPKEVVKETPPPPPAPRNDKHVLVATTAFDNDPVAFVRDTGKLTEPPRPVRLNDELDGGRVVLIHASGIVVRVGARSQAAEKLYFYPLGSKLSERRELTAGEFPDVYEIAQAVLAQ